MVEFSTQERISFHRGAIQVLGGEQAELIKMLSTVQQILQAHIKALKDLGVDIEAEMKSAAEEYQKQQKSQAPTGDNLTGRLA